MEDAAPNPQEGAVSPTRHRRTASPLLRAGLPLVCVVAIVAVAWWMTGPKPLPADAGATKRPPPLVVTDASDPLVRTAAAALADGKIVDARTRFTRIVAEHPDQVDAQVGLVLTSWQGAGPAAVERDLGQLVREYPEDPLPIFTLGLVQVARGESAAARPSIGSSIELGRATEGVVGLAIARLADDLLHPDQFRGYPLMLISERDVPAEDRAALKRLRALLERDDRVAAASEAAALARSSSPTSRAAAAIARYDKASPDDSIDEARALVVSLGTRGGGDAPAAADATRLHAGLLLAWTGSIEQGCTEINAVADAHQPTSWRRLASPIARRICTPASNDRPEDRPPA